MPYTGEDIAFEDEYEGLQHKLAYDSWLTMTLSQTTFLSLVTSPLSTWTLGLDSRVSSRRRSGPSGSSYPPCRQISPTQLVTVRASSQSVTWATYVEVTAMHRTTAAVAMVKGRIVGRQASSILLSPTAYRLPLLAHEPEDI